MVEEMVRVLNTDTHEITSMPASELAAEMIRVQIQGIEGEVWVEASKLRRDSPFRHPPFGEEVKRILRRFEQTFADVYPRTLEEWEEGFRRDANPDKEIAIWVAMEKIFLHFTAGRNLDPEQKKDIFKVILACVNNGPNHVLATTSPRTLSRKRVKEIVEYFQRQGN